MFLWLAVILTSYLFFSLSFFGDKLMLSGKSRAITYAFYIGVLSTLVVVFIPFIDFGLPQLSLVPWIILDGAMYVFGVYAMFLALEKFEVSRVMPTVGALQPVLILVFSWLVWGAQGISVRSIGAFALLLVGSVMISWEKPVRQVQGRSVITKEYAVLVSIASLLFSLDYIFSKVVFLEQPFLQGLIWMRIASFFVALLLLKSKKLRGEVVSMLRFPKEKKMIAQDKQTVLLFFGTQSAGGLAGILQSFAISLVPVSYLAIVNSLRGVQYVFLFLITLMFSHFFPTIFKEDISRRIIIQKVVSIGLIILGLVILVS